MVPSSENKAVFCEIGISCPLQNAQPVGREVEREDADLGDELDRTRAAPQVWLGKTPNSEMMKLMHRIRLHVLVRLAAADRA